MENEIMVEIRLVKDQKATKAVGSITLSTGLGDLTLQKVRVIHQDGKDPWVAYPQVDFADKESGERRHIDIIIPSQRLRKAVSDAVLNKYKELLNGNAPF